MQTGPQDAAKNARGPRKTAAVADDKPAGTVRKVSDDRQLTDYDAYIAGASAYAYAASLGVTIPDDWRRYDGHVTMSPPGAARVPLRIDARVTATGVVRTHRAIALTVTVDDQTHQAGTSRPLHITLATAPKGNGHYPPMVAASDVERAAQSRDTDVTTGPALHLPAVAAPAGTSRATLSERVLDAAAGRTDRVRIEQLQARGMTDDDIVAMLLANGRGNKVVLTAGGSRHSGTSIEVAPGD